MLRVLFFASVAFQELNCHRQCRWMHHICPYRQVAELPHCIHRLAPCLNSHLCPLVWLVRPRGRLHMTYSGPNGSDPGPQIPGYAPSLVVQFVAKRPRWFPFLPPALLRNSRYGAFQCAWLLAFTHGPLLCSRFHLTELSHDVPCQKIVLSS